MSVGLPDPWNGDVYIFSNPKVGSGGISAWYLAGGAGRKFVRCGEHLCAQTPDSLAFMRRDRFSGQWTQMAGVFGGIIDNFSTGSNQKSYVTGFGTGNITMYDLTGQTQIGIGVRDARHTAIDNVLVSLTLNRDSVHMLRPSTGWTQIGGAARHIKAARGIHPATLQRTTVLYATNPTSGDIYRFEPTSSQPNGSWTYIGQP